MKMVNLELTNTSLPQARSHNSTPRACSKQPVLHSIFSDLLEPVARIRPSKASIEVELASIKEENGEDGTQKTEIYMFFCAFQKELMYALR